jgi:hypothetical protein
MTDEEWAFPEPWINKCRPRMAAPAHYAAGEKLRGKVDRNDFASGEETTREFKSQQAWA